MTKENTCNSKAVPSSMSRQACVMHDCPDPAESVDIGQMYNGSRRRTRLCKKHAGEVRAADKSMRWLKKTMSWYK